MYESPIKVIQGELETQLEGEILKAVHRVGVTVDRDELIQALRYDREQYQKGFADARKDAVVVTRCKGCKHYRNHPNGLCYLHTEPKANARGYSGEPVCVEPDDFCSYGEPKEG